MDVGANPRLERTLGGSQRDGALEVVAALRVAQCQPATAEVTQRLSPEIAVAEPFTDRECPLGVTYRLPARLRDDPHRPEVAVGPSQFDQPGGEAGVVVDGLQDVDRATGGVPCRHR